MTVHTIKSSECIDNYAVVLVGEYDLQESRSSGCACGRKEHRLLLVEVLLTHGEYGHVRISGRGQVVGDDGCTLCNPPPSHAQTTEAARQKHTDSVVEHAVMRNSIVAAIMAVESDLLLRRHEGHR